MVVGAGQSVIPANFVGSMAISFSLMIRPKYSTSVMSKTHLSRFRNRSFVRATTKLYTPATSKDNGRASSCCGLTQRDKLREKKEDGGICQFILTIDITTVKWES